MAKKKQTKEKLIPFNPQDVVTHFSDKIKIAKKVKALKKDKRKPKQKVLVKEIILEEPAMKPRVQYHMNILSLVTNKEGIIKEIVYEYMGKLMIPKALKNTLDTKSHAFETTFIVNPDIVHPILTKNYIDLSKKDVKMFLSDQVRESYIMGLRELIHKELMPDYKIIDKLPWK